MSAAGRTYGGRYAVLEAVGSGGMAEVYRGRDELLGREVAIKVLHERFSRDPSFVERFRREAQAAANLNHPNIVSLYDYGNDQGTYFIVMEFIEGRSLADVIRDEGPLMPERAAEIAADVAKALQRAHAAGVVHRDIKPGNIMLTSSGQTKVTDFGIARAVGGDSDATMTQAGMVIGTAAYLSPEQAQGEPVDARSDVYALGVVLYEALTGRAPFSGDTPLSIAYKHVREDPTAPSRIAPDVPRDLDSITLKAMGKEPATRFQSADEMRADLDRYLSGGRVLASPSMTGAQTSVMTGAGSGTQVMGKTDIYDEPPSNRAAWYVAATLIGLLLLGLGVFLFADTLFGGEPVEVPELVGLTESAARDELEDLGLDAEVTYKKSNKPADEVIAQDPEAGETVEEGDTVALTVSGGARQTEVPDLTGMTREEAETALEEAKLDIGIVTSDPNNDFEPGQVFDQDPAPGETVDRGTKVDITISSGGETVLVPFVTNQTEEEAVAEIENAGLVAEVSRQPDDAEAGTVIEQDPAGGTEATAGDTVRLLVSEGPEEREMPDVRGLDGDEAEASLEEDYGLNVTQQTETEPCDQPPGRVCRQDPAPGEPVASGDSATLYVQGGGATLGPPSVATFLGTSSTGTRWNGLLLTFLGTLLT